MGPAPKEGGGHGNGSADAGATGTGHQSYGTEPPAPKPDAKVSCSYSGSSHQVALRCGVSGGGKGAGAVRFRLVHGGKVLGTSRARISGGRVRTVVRSRRRLAGSYELLATVDREDGVTAFSQAVELPGRSSMRLH